MTIDYLALPYIFSLNSLTARPSISLHRRSPGPGDPFEPIWTRGFASEAARKVYFDAI